jgi:hypothetical protein
VLQFGAGSSSTIGLLCYATVLEWASTLVGCERSRQRQLQPQVAVAWSSHATCTCKMHGALQLHRHHQLIMCPWDMYGFARCRFISDFLAGLSPNTRKALAAVARLENHKKDQVGQPQRQCGWAASALMCAVCLEQCGSARRLTGLPVLQCCSFQR